MSDVIRSNQASGAFQPWQMRAFDAPPVVETPKDIEPLPSNTPLEIAPGVSLPTAEDIERIHQDAWKEGYSAGYEEGSARGRLEAAELHQMVQSLDEALGKIDQEVAEEIRALAIEIARQVVRETLSVKDDVILAVAREGLLALPQGAAVLRVNPADAELLRRYLADQYASVGHRVNEDARVSRGGCFIESPGGQIDGEVQTRWRRVVENLTRSAAEFLDE